MKSFSTLQLKLLNALSDNQCHSGQSLADALNVSRTAIWKQISTLSELGLNINRLPKQGYQLSEPYIALDTQGIIQGVHHLNAKLANQLNLYTFATIPSTNQFLKTLSSQEHQIQACIAEKQTEGRGRFRRPWHSPFGQNIYCSLKIHFHGCPSTLSGLSLVISLAIHEVLKQYTNTPIYIKWPNDLIAEHKKLAGILIELSGEGNSGTDVIIGMGININDTKTVYASLQQITAKFFDRNLIVSKLITTVYQYLLVFESRGFKAFQSAWNQLDYLKSQSLQINQTNQCITGFGRGVDAMGYLLVESEKGVIHTLSSGDTSLKQAYMHIPKD